MEGGKTEQTEGENQKEGGRGSEETERERGIERENRIEFIHSFLILYSTAYL